MDNQFEELQSILTDELNIHTNLVTIAEEMNSAIKGKDVVKVQRYTAQFDACIGQIEVLEIKRLELCDGIAQVFKPKNRHLNLQSIIALMPEDKQKIISKTRASLKSKINDLVKINISNQLLLNESLLVIGKNFELVTRFQNKLAGYKHTGAMDKEPVRKNIVNQIA